MGIRPSHWIRLCPETHLFHFLFYCYCFPTMLENVKHELEPWWLKCIEVFFLYCNLFVICEDPGKRLHHPQQCLRILKDELILYFLVALMFNLFKKLIIAIIKSRLFIIVCFCCQINPEYCTFYWNVVRLPYCLWTFHWGEKEPICAQYTMNRMSTLQNHKILVWMQMKLYSCDKYYQYVSECWISPWILQPLSPTAVSSLWCAVG